MLNRKIVESLFLEYGYKYQLEEIREVVEVNEFDTVYEAIEYFKEMEEEE